MFGNVVFDRCMSNDCSFTPLSRVIWLTERNVNMTHNDLARLSPEEFIAFIIWHSERQGYALEERQPAPAGKLLLFRLDDALHMVYCLGPFWDATSVEVAWCASATKVLTAACDDISTRSRFSFGQRRKLNTPAWILC